MCCFRISISISSHAHKTGSWYLLGVLFKISNENPGVPLHHHPPPPPPRDKLRLLKCFNDVGQSTIQSHANLLSYFFVKKISLSRRDGYVVDGSMDQ